MSWGILLPMGAIFARYLKTFKSADADEGDQASREGVPPCISNQEAGMSCCLPLAYLCAFSQTDCYVHLFARFALCCRRYLCFPCSAKQESRFLLTLGMKMLGNFSLIVKCHWTTLSTLL